MVPSAQAVSPAIVQGLRQSLEDIAQPGLVSAYLFGSRARGREHRESDVDVGVLLSWSLDRSARFAVRVELASFLPGKLGVRDVDVVVLNDAPPHLARRIVLDGIRLSCTNAEVDHSFRRDIQLRAADLEPFLRRTRRVKLEALAQ